jgi:hypothetical protein
MSIHMLQTHAAAELSHTRGTVGPSAICDKTSPRNPAHPLLQSLNPPLDPPRPPPCIYTRIEEDDVAVCTFCSSEFNTDKPGHRKSGNIYGTGSKNNMPNAVRTFIKTSLPRTSSTGGNGTSASRTALPATRTSGKQQKKNNYR